MVKHIFRRRESYDNSHRNPQKLTPSVAKAIILRGEPSLLGAYLGRSRQEIDPNKGHPAMAGAALK